MRELRKLPLDQLTVPKQNVRTVNIDKGIEELMTSIKALGLIEPISAYHDAADGRYVVIAGQRRLNAYYALNEKYPGKGFDKIECILRDPPHDDNEKIALSLSENLTHLEMANEDLVRSVTDLYNVYNDYKLVAEKFGLTEYVVDKFVRLARLPPLLKEAIRNGEIHNDPKKAENIALDAVKALNWRKGGAIKEKDVVEFAKKLGEKSGDERRDIVKETQKDPTRPYTEIEKKTAQKTKKLLKLFLDNDLDNKLENYGNKQGQDREEAALDILSDRLNVLESDTEYE